MDYWLTIDDDFLQCEHCNECYGLDYFPQCFCCDDMSKILCFDCDSKKKVTIQKYICDCCLMVTNDEKIRYHCRNPKEREVTDIINIVKELRRMYFSSDIIMDHLNSQKEVISQEIKRLQDEILIIDEHIEEVIKFENE